MPRVRLPGHWALRLLRGQLQPRLLPHRLLVPPVAFLIPARALIPHAPIARHVPLPLQIPPSLGYGEAGAPPTIPGQ